MGILDSILTETRTQLGISARSAGAVLSSVLALITQDGGMAVFLDRFRRVAGSNVVASWLLGDARIVSTSVVEVAMGHQTIDRISARAGLSFTTASRAIAMMLPQVVQRLAPGGVVPRQLSPEVLSYVTVMAPASAVAAATQSDTVTNDVPDHHYIWPLVLFLLAAAAFLAWIATREFGIESAFGQ